MAGMGNRDSEEENEYSDSTTDTGESDSDNEDPVYSNDYVPNWQPHTLGLRRVPFTKNSGLCVPLPGLNRPVDYFFLLLDDEFLEHVVRCTNTYAFDLFCGPNTTPASRIHRWKDLTVPELKVFLALLIHQGNIKINRLQDYWKTDDLYDVGFFKRHMSRDRFMIIYRCLHFSIDDEGHKEERLHKVQHLIDYFNNKMRQVYYPSKELSIDEGMMLWRGRLVFRQYVKGKRHKYGVKFYSLCESQGLTLQLIIYSGSQDQTVGGVGHAAKVVMKLMEPYLGNGHAVYIDNYYTSFSLAVQLLANKTYCTGTVRIDRKFVPQVIRDAKLKKGETTQVYAEGVCLAKWRDKRNVSYLSTEHDNTMGESLNRHGQPRSKPLPIIQYNVYMKGVDRVDQMMAYYPSERKTVRWYKKVFVHFIQVIIVNGLALYNATNFDKKEQLYNYRSMVIRALLPPTVPNQIVSTKKRANHVLSKTDDRLADGRRKKRKCRQCTKEKKRTETVHYCPSCPGQPPLCAVRCFDVFHDSL